MRGERRPELAELRIADARARWGELGFAVAGGHVDVGGIRIHLGAPGHGIVAWALRGVEVAEIDGLAAFAPGAGPDHTSTTPRVRLSHGNSPTPRHRQPNSLRAEGPRHSNGAMAIDQVVVVTPAFDRTSAALAAAGLPLRRIREAGGFRQGFRRLGPAILELVEARDAPAGPAAFWGLVVIVPDLDALASSLGERLGAARDAVQPGRRIAPLRESAGLGLALAFMDPEPSYT